MSTPAVVITTFDNSSWADQIKDGFVKLSHSQRVKLPEGTIVLYANKDLSAFVGVATLKNWPDIESPCRLQHPLDDSIYTGPADKYNKYDIRISDHRIFKNPFSYASVKKMLGPVNAAGQTNMWRNSITSWRRAFHTLDSDKDLATVEKFNLWAQSLL